MDYIKIRTFDKYQHYHKKSITAWIKLYFAIMDDYEFEKLPPMGKWYFVGLLLLAGKLENNIPFDTKYLANKLGGEPEDIRNTVLSINKTLLIIIKDKKRIDKIREDSPNKNRQDIEKVKTKSRQSLELSTNKLDIDTEFELVWKTYPRREGRKGALKHFKATVKTPEDLENIKLAVKNYADYITKAGKDREFTKMGSTFFNDWEEWVVSPADEEERRKRLAYNEGR